MNTDVDSILSQASHFVVTGGAGAIGSQLVETLLQRTSCPVFILDNFESGYHWLVPENERVTLIESDVCDIANTSIPGNGAVVFHLAAFFANQNSVDHPQDDLHTNGLGTLNVLHWAASQDAKRVVYASAGCSIAGHDVDGPIREDMPVSLDLDTPYQITKALGEFYCNYYRDRVETVRCRFFNSYGPGEVPGHYRNVIPNFIWLALNDEPLTITGTGEETRDFIFVADLVDGLIRAACVEEASGMAFNLGTGRETRVIDLAEKIIALCGSSSELKYAPRRAWDNSVRRQADVSRGKEVLGCRPDTNLDEGLQAAIHWFKENIEEIRKTAG